jgi:uncharacterized protein (TIGR03000 family)
VIGAVAVIPSEVNNYQCPGIAIAEKEVGLPYKPKNARSTMSHFLKIGFAATALLVLSVGSARAQLYDMFEVIRFQDRTVYIFPKGYAPALATPFAPVAYPWYNWYAQPTAPMVASPGMLPRDTVSPLSYSGATDASASSTSITLRVPEDAEVWIQGKKMDEKGTERRFNLPSLDPRSTYDYDIRVDWTANGRKMSDTSKLSVRAGDQQSITYIAAMAGSKTGSSAPASQEEAAQGK